MATTIQVHEGVRAELASLKEDSETYEDVIKRIMRENEKWRRENKALLIEGYKAMAEESLKICEEFKFADAEVAEKYGD